MLTVFFIKGESLPNDKRSTAGSEEQADEGINPSHVKYHDQDKGSEQSAGKNEKVLCFQPFKLHGSSNALVDVVIIHETLGLKEEGAQDGSSNN